MDKQAVEIFSRLIDASIDYKILQKECIEEESCSRQAIKRPKLSPSAIRRDEAVPVTTIVIEQLLEECINDKTNTLSKIEDLITLQIQEVIKLYKQGSSYDRDITRTVSFFNAILRRNIITLEQLSQTLLLSPEINDLPLNFIWHLSQLKLLSFQQIIQRVKETQNATRLVEDALKLILKESTGDSVEYVLKDFVAILVFISCELLDKEFESLQQASSNLLSHLVGKFLDAISVTVEMEEEESSKKDFINVFDLLLEEKSLTSKSVKQFFSSQLILILTFKPEVRLSHAIQQQSKWRSTNTNKALSQVLFSIVKGLGYEECFETLDKVVSSLEVNWGYLLSFLGTLLLADPNSAAKLKVVVDLYLRKGCSENETEYLILAFLFARHASMEGRHVFPSYSQWFGATFGSEASSPANNKQAFTVLVHFLTSLVPYESVPVLKAHLHQSIFLPKGCQASFRDYQRLVRVRLQELNDDCSAHAGEPKAFNQSQSKIGSDVESAISLFEKSRKIPSFILEAAIFKRPYFLSSFLPLLLTPRVLPDVADAKMNLIKELVSLGKIPAKMYTTYVEDCQKAADGSLNQGGSEVGSGNPIPQGPFSTLQKSMKDFVSLTLKAETEEDATNSQAMRMLSQMTQALEDLTSLSNLELKEVPHLIINQRDFDPTSVLYQVIEEVMVGTERLMSHSVASIASAGVAKLCVVLCGSPSVQQAFLTTMVHLFSQHLQLNSNRVEALGVLLWESIGTEEMFLPAVLSSSSETEASSASNLLVASLNRKNEADIYFSCCVVKVCLEWASKAKRKGEPSLAPTKEAKLKSLRHLYFCLAARVAVMDLRELHWIKYATIQPTFICNLPLIEGSKVPQCCQILVEMFDEIMQDAEFEDWIAFELETFWGRTSLDTRLRHLHFWFSHFVKVSRETIENQFLFLFWKLVDSGVGKNSAELLVLLQRVSFEDLHKISLLHEWKEWKKVLLTQGKSEVAHHIKLYAFLSLCHCLPVSLFVGRVPSVATLSIFQKIEADILEMEGDLFLSLKDTTYFLESFLDACQKLNPHESQVWHCFAFRDSVLYHLKALSPILKKYQPLLNQYRCLSSLTTIDVERPPTFKSLPGRDAAALLSSLLVQGPPNVEFFSLTSEQTRPVVFRQLMAVLGRHLILTGRVEDRVEEYNFVYSQEEGSIRRMEGSLGLILDGMSPDNRSGNGQNDPIKWMDDWKQETGLSPLTWKAFLFGCTQVLLTKIPQTESSEKSHAKLSWLFSLLLLCFSHLAKLFERDAESQSPSLDYLSRLSTRIYAVLDLLPTTCLRTIPEGILKICDKDLMIEIQRKTLQNT